MATSVHTIALLDLSSATRWVESPECLQAFL
jgi:hypothetical protein